MALAKDRTLEDPQFRTLYGGGPSLIQSLDHPPSLELFGYKNHADLMLEEGESSDSLGSYSGSILPMLSDASNYSSSRYSFGAVNSPPQIVVSAVATEQWAYSSSAVLSFEQGQDRLPCASYLSLDGEDECSAWMNNAMVQSYQLDSRLIDQHQSCSSMGIITNSAFKDKRHSEDQFGLLYSGTATVVHGLQECIGQAKNLHKRPNADSEMQSPKRQCLSNRKSKENPSQTKDPQSIAAKNRRERISERLKVLQELVPNGTKVDLVTMLEKAISYVKFLQLQVKVLATDEFWPAQGGKAPELSQVKEAIDAILSSQRDRNSSSKQ